jgi:hypothetical protein
MQQIQCSRCGYTLAGMPGGVAACPNCGQQTMIPGAAPANWGAPQQQPPQAPYPGAQPGYGTQPDYGAQPGYPGGGTQPGYGAPQSGNPYGAPQAPAGQSNYGSGPSYGQPATPYGAPGQYSAPGQYPPPSPDYAPPPMQGYQPPMAPPPAARRNPIIPIALVVVLLLVAGGAYLFIKNKNNGGGTLPSGYTLYTDTAGLYTIGYPGGWSKTATGASGVSEVLFANADHSDIFEVAETPAAGLSTSDLSAVLGGFFTGFAGSLPGGGGSVSNQSSPQNVTIAGQTWTQEGGDVAYSDASGNPAAAHAEVSAISRNSHIFILAYVTQDSSKFSGEKTQYFSPMINSFAFKG